MNKVKNTKGVNQNGAIFMRHSGHSIFVKDVLDFGKARFHESLHSIFDRTAGTFNPYVSLKLFRNEPKHQNKYFEKVLSPFINRLFS